MSNLIGPALVHIRAAERDGVAARTMPAVRRLSISWDPPTDPPDRLSATARAVVVPGAKAELPYREL